MSLRTIVCAQCSRSASVDSRAKYCSKSCAWVATKGPEYNARIAAQSADKRGAAQRDRGACVNTYRKVGGRHEHRAVAERMIGRPLARGEIVHHIDGDKRNNAPANLAVMTQAQHMREHGMGIPGVLPMRFRRAS